MKILYLHQYYATPNMTGSTRSYEMARRLVEKGHEVHLITSDLTGERKKWQQTEEAGINVHWYPLPYSNKMSYRDRIKAFTMYAIVAARKGGTIKSDIVFATSTPLTIAIPAVYVSRRQNIPMVFEVRDLWPEAPIAIGALRNPSAINAAQWLEKFAYNNAAHVIALSPGMKEGVISTGYPEKQVTVIPNSCDLDLFNIDPSEGQKLRNSYNWLKDKPLIIYSGTIGYVNGIDYMVRLAKEVQKINKSIRFVVLGTGKEEDNIRELANEFDILNNSFFMLGTVPKNQIPAWLSAADIATSFFIDNEATWKNSANKFFDALAAGKPIAINYGGWQADIIRENNNGIFLDPHKPESSAKKLADAIKNVKWLEDAGNASRSLALNVFNRDILAIELENILINTIENK